MNKQQDFSLAATAAQQDFELVSVFLDNFFKDIDCSGTVTLRWYESVKAPDGLVHVIERSLKTSCKFNVVLCCDLLQRFKRYYDLFTSSVKDYKDLQNGEFVSRVDLKNKRAGMRIRIHTRRNEQGGNPKSDTAFQELDVICMGLQDEKKELKRLIEQLQDSCYRFCILGQTNFPKAHVLNLSQANEFEL